MASGGDNVKVIGAKPSPFVVRARVALNLKGIKYEFLEETFGTKSELLLKSNPVHKKIPVLLHNDKPICESLVIVQYVDEVFHSGPSILPSDPYDRAIARFWAAYIDEKWFPSLSSIGRAQTEEAKTAAIDQVKQGLILLEGVFQDCSKGKAPYFSGTDEIGYLDIAFGCFLAWLRVTEKMNGLNLLDEDKVSGLARWAVRFAEHPSVKGVLLETDELMEFAKKLMAKFKGGPAVGK